jgi:hypothetical protein
MCLDKSSVCREQLSNWADKKSEDVGEMGTNVVWMEPQLWQPDAGKKKHH